VLVAIPSMAQLDRNIIKRLTQVDRQRWHFGFILGMNFADFVTQPSASWKDEDGNSWYSASAGLSPAFNVGMIIDLRCVEYLNIRFTPVLNLGERHLNYTCFNPAGERIGDIKTTSVATTTIDIPFYIKYSAKRYGNVRPYIIAGGGPQFNLNLDPEVPILLNPFDVQIAFGIGLNIYTEYFKFCPEIKFAFGLLDQLNRNHPEMEGTDNILFTSSVDRLTSRMLIISFNFE
jgi:hypothetical protein